MRGLALLPLAMLLMQLPLLWLARRLGRPLSRGAIAAGWLVPLLLLAPWLPGQRLLVPCNMLAETFRQGIVPAPHAGLNDAIFQLLPWELEVRHAFAARRLPLWSDRLDGGSSPWANPQAQVLSPVAMLARLLPIQHDLLACLALKLMVALQGAWLVCRRLGTRSPAALVGGTAFALGGGVIAWALFPVSTAAAWTPWVIAGVLALARRPDRGTAVALALATAALLLAGHPETALAAVALAAAVGIALRAPRVSRRRFLGFALAGGLLGAALAAPLLLPFTAAVERSLRASEHLATPHMPLPIAGLTWVDGGRISFLRGPWSPRVYGTPYGPTFNGPLAWPVALSGYTGLVAIAGAAAALAGRRRRRAMVLLAGWGLALLLTLQLTPVEALRLHVPLLRMAEATRFLHVGALALALMGALGWDELRRRGRPALWVVAGLPLALGIVLASDALDAALVAAVLAGAVLLARRPRLGWAVVAVALLLDLVPWGRAQLPADLPAFFYPRVPLVERVTAEVEGGAYRAVGESYSLYPALLTVYGVPEARPHNPLAPRDYLSVLKRAFAFAPSSQLYFAPFGNVEHPLLDFLGVRVVVSDLGQPPKKRLLRLDHGELDVYRLFGNPQALPRWFLPTAVELVPRRQTLDWIAALSDARRVAISSEEAEGWQPANRAWDASAVHALVATPGRITLAVGGEGERLLATSLPGPFGWHASAGGKGLAGLTVDGAFLAVRVPAGVDRVELRYVPPGLVAGALVASAAALMLLALIVPVVAGDWRRAWRSLRPA